MESNNLQRDISSNLDGMHGSPLWAAHASPETAQEISGDVHREHRDFFTLHQGLGSKTKLKDMSGC